MQRPTGWSPYPGPQTQALTSEADIILYGGAAGGGKTDLLLGAAKGSHRGIIFRRVFPNLRGIIDRSREIFNPAGERAARDTYNESLHRWRHGENQELLFGALQYEDDKFNHQGQAKDYHGFDEITEFSETQFRFIIGWNRSTRPGQRCRVICTSNPPMGQQGAWIISFWAPWLDPHHKNPAKPGEIRWFAVIAGKDFEMPDNRPFVFDKSEKLESGQRPTPVYEFDKTKYDETDIITPKSRTFIPARVTDNPALVRSGYISTLQSMPEPMRSKLLYGDFLTGGDEDPWQIIPSEWVRLAQERWRNMQKPTTPLSAIGVDIARGGRDQTILTPRWDNYFGWQETYPGKDTPDGPGTKDLIIKCLHSNNGNASTQINVDVIGVGSSPYDFTVIEHANTNPMAAGNGSDARDKSDMLGFANKKAEWWWKLREALDPDSGDNLALPDDRELMVDLCTPHWKPTARGIQVESKDDVKKRIGRSTDKGDSLVLAHALDWGVGDAMLAAYAAKDRMAAEEAAKKL